MVLIVTGYSIEMFFSLLGMEVSSGTTQSCYPSLHETNCQNGVLQYELDYNCDHANIIRSSRKTQPFFALFAVGNFDHCFSNMYFRVRSYRPNTETIVLYIGNHTLNNFFLHYEAQCRNGTFYASLCDVWFYVINTEKWNSSAPPTTEVYSRTYSSYYYFGWSIPEAVSNTLFGYTMVARKKSTLIPETEINEVTYKMLKIISETDNLCPDCFCGDGVLSVPVQFSIGNDSVVNSMLPPSVKPLLTGFLQFRAYGRTGSVYAMCPAVKVDDWRSEYVCIGGMKNPNTSYLDDCNDFTNWNGMPNTAVQKDTPVAYSHSQRALDATIMIFYR